MRKRKERRAARLARARSEGVAAKAFTRLRNCKHEKRTRYGVCERCGNLQRPDPDQLDEPVHQQTTAIIQPGSVEDLKRLFRKLAALMSLAPKSSALTIAVTAKRTTIVKRSVSSNQFFDATKQIDE